MAISSASLLLLRRGAASALRRSISTAAANPSFSLTSAPKPPLTYFQSSSSSPSSLAWNPNKHRLIHSLRDFSSAAASALEASEPAAAVRDRVKFGYEEHNPRDIGIEEIEGCDFKHWLVVVDFKDPKPSREQMISFYEETCAKALNISLEEAKKKIYACSTTNYTGFHVEVTEIESEKFNDQPQVCFVLPDSYVDKEKKEYGGDKYINGIIIPRSRPTLHGKRIRDDLRQDNHRQRSPSSSQESLEHRGQRPNLHSSGGHEEPAQGRPTSNQPNTPYYNHQGVMKGTRGNHGAPQSYPSPQSNIQGQWERRDQGNYHSQPNYSPPAQGENSHPPNYSFQQNYGPPGQGERSDTMQMIPPGRRSPYQQGNGGLAYQGNCNQGWAGNFHPHEYREFPQGYQMNYVSPRLQGGFREDYQNFRPAQGTPYGQGANGYQGHGISEAYDQGMDARFVQQGYRGAIHRPLGGYQGHGIPERNWQGMDVRSFRQCYRESIQNRAFTQVDQRNFPGPGFQERGEFPGPGFQEHGEFPGPGFQEHGEFPGPGFQEHRACHGPSFQEPRAIPRSGFQETRAFPGPGFQEPRAFPGLGNQERWEFPGREFARPNFQEPRAFPRSGFHEPRAFPGLGFQEHREIPGPGYHRNHAPTGEYQGGFREEFRYYGLTHVEPYEQGQRGPEVYQQGANYGTVGYGYEGPIGTQSVSQSEARNTQAPNFYSQGSNEFPHGGQRSSIPPRYNPHFRHDYQHYGPPQGTPYQQEDHGYQAQGPPMAYRRGPNF